MTKRNFEYILFDWDGCLANTLSIWMEVYKQVFAEYGYHPSEKDIVEKVFGNWDGQANIGPMDGDDFRKKLFSGVTPRLEQASLHKNVQDTLETLKIKKKKMAVLSSSNKDTVLKAISFNKLDSYFECVLAKEDVAKMKPNPEGIYKVINLLKANSDQCIIIGDGDKDVEAGKNAKIVTLLYYPKANNNIYKKDFLLSLKADYFIEDFRELVKIVG